MEPGKSGDVERFVCYRTEYRAHSKQDYDGGEQRECGQRRAAWWRKGR